MTANKDFKRKIRSRMATTREPYTKARSQIEGGLKCWTLAGSKPADYEIGVDADGPSGSRCAYLRSKSADASGFGTLMQTIAANEFLGKRVRFTARVEAAEVAAWAGLWMRVDGQSGSAPLGFDNMEQRPIRGSGPWTRHAVVLDVPREAQAIAFGILLTGAGRVRLAGVAFGAVDPSVASTAMTKPKRPQNLDFAEIA
jgi:hypothetical protein